MLRIFVFALVLGCVINPNFRGAHSDEITIARPTLRSVRFVDERNGWIAGHAGVFRTKDGGETWERQSIIGLPLRRNVSRAGTEQTGRIAWADPEVAIIRYDDSLVVIRAGVTEQRVIKPPAKGLDELYAMVFADREVGWGVGTRGLHRTTDSGATWTLVEAPVRMTAIYSSSRTEVWAVGDLSTVLHSSDGGERWTQQSLYRGMSQYGGTAQFLAVQFVNPAQGWVSGTDGLVFYTGDGGRMWQKQITPFSRFTALSALSFIDDREGWVVGTRYLDSKYHAVVLHTEDGGRHWTSQIEGISDMLLDVQGLSNGRAWAVGSRGSVLRTDDHGKTWISIKL